MVNVLKKGKGVSVGPCVGSIDCKQEACLFRGQKESECSWSRMGKREVVAGEIRKIEPYRPIRSLALTLSNNFWPK